MSICFSHTFNFVDTNPSIHSALQHIHDVVLKFVPVAYPVDLHEEPMMKSMMECHNVTGGPEDEDDTRNINIPKIEGSQDIAAAEILTDKINQPLKV